MKGGEFNGEIGRYQERSQKETPEVSEREEGGQGGKEEGEVTRPGRGNLSKVLFLWPLRHAPREQEIIFQGVPSIGNRTVPAHLKQA
jgi:hypothetical protein